MADFEPLADALREAVVSFYDERGLSLEGAAGHNTLETNSGFVERRGRPLLQMLDMDPAGIRVVDVGCGFGALSVFLAFHGAHVTGLDPNAERFAVGRAVGERFGLAVEFVKARMQRMPLESRTYDLAVLNNSLCYVVEPEARTHSLAEVLRVLRPGGRMIVRNPNRWSMKDQFTGLPVVHMLPARTASRVAERLGRRRSTVRLHSPSAAVDELRAAGFADVRHHGFPGSRRPDVLKYVARYQHLTARRPMTHGEP
jgi:ubiquinone/menaquinone biosynthesis C-methylase UbiE